MEYAIYSFNVLRNIFLKPWRLKRLWWHVNNITWNMGGAERLNPLDIQEGR